MVNQQKKQKVEALKKLLLEAPSLALIKFEKTTHQQLEALKKSLRQTKASFTVIKNTLFEKAVNKIKNPIFFELKKTFFPLKEPSALIIFDKNWDEGLKVFHQFAQKEKSLSFKFSLLDNVLYDREKTEKIALLPSKNELLAKLISSFKTPVYRLNNALKNPLNRFVYILKNKAKKS